MASETFVEPLEAAKEEARPSSCDEVAVKIESRCQEKRDWRCR